MNSRAAIIATVGLATLAGCSTFEARKLDSTEEIGAVEGIPYVLTRAEPRLTRTLKDGKPAYDLTIVYVPDPDQRYTLRTNPSWIADVDFSLGFDDDGTLKTIDAVTTERITPTITALGSLIATVLPLAAFREEGGPRIQVRFAKAFKAQLSAFDCPESDNPDPQEPINMQLLELVAQIEAEVVAWASIDGSIDPDGTFKALFFVETNLQKQCLNELADHLAAGPGGGTAPAASDAGGPKEMVAFLRRVPVYGLAERRAHQVAKLQRELNQAIQLTALDPDHNHDVEAKREALAQAVDKGAEFIQLRKIEEALTNVGPQPSGKSSAYEEYARMREQAKALRTEIADAVGEALTDLAPPVLKPFSGRPVRIVDAGCFRTPPTGKRCPNDGDEFVVVFDRVQGGQPGDQR